MPRTKDALIAEVTRALAVVQSYAGEQDRLILERLRDRELRLRALLMNLRLLGFENGSELAALEDKLALALRGDVAPVPYHGQMGLAERVVKCGTLHCVAGCSPQNGHAHDSPRFPFVEQVEAQRKRLLREIASHLAPPVERLVRVPIEIRLPVPPRTVSFFAQRFTTMTRGELFLVHAGCAASGRWRIKSIRAGHTELLSEDGLRAANFPRFGGTGNISGGYCPTFPTLRPSEVIRVSVENESDEPGTFDAVLETLQLVP